MDVINVKMVIVLKINNVIIVQIKQKIVFHVKVKQVNVINVKMNIYYQIQNVFIIHQLNIVNQNKIINVHLVHFGINQIQIETYCDSHVEWWLLLLLFYCYWLYDIDCIYCLYFK